MANPEHVKWLKEGVETWNERREQEDFIPNLRDAKLRGDDLFKANLTNAVLIKADLRNAILTNTDLRGANFLFADLSGANLFNAKLSGADLRYAILTGADLSYSKPWKAKLYHVSTESGTIQGAAGAAQEKNKKKIKSIECLLQKCRGLRKKYKKTHSDDVEFFFREKGVAHGSCVLP